MSNGEGSVFGAPNPLSQAMTPNGLTAQQAQMNVGSQVQAAVPGFAAQAQSVYRPGPPQFGAPIGFNQYQGGPYGQYQMQPDSRRFGAVLGAPFIDSTPIIAPPVYSPRMPYASPYYSSPVVNPYPMVDPYGYGSVMDPYGYSPMIGDPYGYSPMIY